MKTIQEIMDFNREASEIIRDLQSITLVLPNWAELEKQYDDKKHPIWTDPKYIDDPSKDVKLTRISLGWNKLAVKRMAELCFGIPVKRVYNAKNDKEQEVADIIESIYKKNHIDSINIQRARMLYAGCQFATIWYSQLQETMYGGKTSKLKLRCRTFTPMRGEKIYPLFDEYDDLIALSVEYNRTIAGVNTKYFETYTASEHVRWVLTNNKWAEEEGSRQQIQIGKIAGVFAYRNEPVWESESENVYEAEWELSRNGNYLRKNSKPTWVVCSDEDIKSRKREKESDTQSRNVLHYPANAKVGYETWNQSIETLKFQNEQIRRNYFMQLQLPDMSFESMKSTPMSGEARKMMFIDSQLKVLDESGLWCETFERELNVIKAFMRTMYPSLVGAIESLDVQFVITPYQIKDELEKAQIAQTLNGGKPIISQRTSIQRYGDVENVDEEMRYINEESASALEEIAY